MNVPSRAGELLRLWRTRRRLSQLELAGIAGVSTKHLSYIETGRAIPSTEMVLSLGSALDIPLHERDAILIGAGHAPRYTAERDDARPSAESHEMSAAIVDAHRYPAIVIDHRWNVIAFNSAASIITDGVAGHLLHPPINLVRLSLRRDGLASRILNLPEYSAQVLARLRRQVAGRPDRFIAGLIDEFAHLETDRSPGPIIAFPMHLRVGDQVIGFVSTVATLGAPSQGVNSSTAIETFFPADSQSRAILDAALAGHHL